MLSQKNQIKNYLGKAKNILLLSKQSYHGDDLASVLAWSLWLNKLGKQHDVVIPGFMPKPQLKFLPHWDSIKNNLHKLKKFTINVNIDRSGLDDFSYDVTADQLKLYLTPERGFIDNHDISFQNTDFKYDLVILLGVPDYNSLSYLYQQHADFFYQVPTINIDNHYLNEHFADINEVDITKTSIAEISYDIMTMIAPDLIDDSVATCLLTGLLSATQSFRSNSVTPQTLQLASDLIQRGADRKKIVEQLFNTKSVSMLKLWGRVLARLKIDNRYQLGWSLINQQDMKRSGAGEEDIPGVIEELILTSPQIGIALIFYATADDKTKIWLHSGRNFDSLQLANNYQPQGDKDLATFIVEDNIINSSEVVLADTKRRLQSVLT
ncbi:MAG: DHH family phosphoesterase [Candidatus Komeilibacteria bacterium]